MSIKIGTGSSAVEPSELRLAGLTSPVSRVMVGIGDDAVPAYERAILPLQPMIVGSPTWAYLPDNAEYGKLAEFTVSGKGKGRFKVNVATFSDTQTNNLRRRLELRYNTVTIASWTSWDNDFWNVIDSLSDEFDFPEDAKIEVWGELGNDHWENRHYRWWRVEVVPSEIQDPSALIPISLSGGRVRGTEGFSSAEVFKERMRGSGMVNIAASLDAGGFTNGGDSLRRVRVWINGSLLGNASERVSGRSTLEFLHEGVYLEDNDQVMVQVENYSNMNMIMYGWTVDITTVRVEEPVDPAVETTTALTIDPSSVEVGESVTLTASVTPAEATGEVTFALDGQTYTVSLVSGVATTEVTVDTEGTFEATASFVPTSTDDFEPSSDTATLTVEEVEEVREVVKITATSTWDSQDQFRAALEDRGLHYSTVETVPFDIDATGSTVLYSTFGGCVALVEAPKIDITDVPSIERLFSGCSSLEYVPDMHTAHVTNMYMLFYGCSSLTDGNVRLFGKHPDVDTRYMISGSGLTFEPFYTEGETVTDLTITPSSVIAGNPVTFTATITPPEAEGVVEFLVGNQTLTADVVDGVATTTAIPQQTGEYDVTANFIPGSEDFLPSSDTASVNVTLIVTSTVLTVAGEVNIGDPITMTATVTPSEAVGEVTFTVGTQTSTVTLEAGTAQSTVTIEDPGLYDIMAEFIPAPGADFLPSSDTTSITVIEGAPQVVVIDASGGYREAWYQIVSALEDRGLHFSTVETIPFDLDTSQATNLNDFFYDFSSLTEVPEMDTSNVTSMSSMFHGCSSLTEVPEMDTSNVTSMGSMFRDCSSLEYVPDMDTHNVTNANFMFMNCESLTDGNVRLIGRHPDVQTLMMIDNSGLTREPFFVPAVETTTALSVVPTEITEGESISLTATVTPADAVGSVTFTVAGETSVVEVVEGTAATTLTVDQVGTHEVTADFTPDDDLDFMPSSDIASITVTAGPVILTGSGTEPRDQFRAALSSLGLSHGSIEAVPFPLDTSETTSLQGLFSSCSTLTEVPEMDTSSVTDMSHMFNGCRKLTNIPDMDTSKVTNMSYMFAACSDLTEAPEMDTSSVTDMAYMFQACSSLTYIPDMDTSNVTNMRYTLMGTSALVDGNVRFLGKHPDVAAINVIQGSSLTRVPWYEVETQTELSTDPFEVTEGGTATLRVMVTPASATGSVTFTLGGETVTVPVIDGVAATNVTVMQAGDYEVNVLFSPVSENYLPSSATGNLKVLESVPAVETSTTISVVPSEITEGEQVALTATVTPSDAVGEVTFTVDTQTSTVALEAGTASTTLTLDTPGVYGVTAEFVPSSVDDFTASSATGAVNVIPAPVETSTSLTVVPEELEEGELVTVTATVTPAEAAGVIEFDVAGQLSSVNVVNGEASTTATLDEAGEYAITADFVPSSELDFLPSSATGSITVTEPAAPELVPMSWSGGSLSGSSQHEIFEVVSYTVVGEGVANLPATFRANGNHSYNRDSTRNMILYLNGVEIRNEEIKAKGTHTHSHTFVNVPLRDGDVLVYGVQNRATLNRSLLSWSLDLEPVDSYYGFEAELGSGVLERTFEEGEITSHVIQGYEGEVMVSFNTKMSIVSNPSATIEITHNGVQALRYTNYSWSAEYGIAYTLIQVSPGDVISVHVFMNHADESIRAYESMTFTIF